MSLSFFAVSVMFPVFISTYLSCDALTFCIPSPPDFPVCVCGKKPRGRTVYRKPVTASEEELAVNNRSRSAKLRVIEKL